MQTSSLYHDENTALVALRRRSLHGLWDIADAIAGEEDAASARVTGTGILVSSIRLNLRFLP
jgi:hypothetical protein